MKKQKGITLVALVVTIIILLILAGISISSLTNSGLFEKAREAEEKSQNAQEQENSILAQYEDIINGYLVGTTREDGSVSKEQYDQLVVEIESLKTALQTTTEENEKLKQKGTWELLAKTTSSSGQTFTINDIDNYSTLVLQNSEVDDIVAYTLTTSPSIFKTKKLCITECNISDICMAEYISNTQVKLQMLASWGGTAYLYGIK